MPAANQIRLLKSNGSGRWEEFHFTATPDSLLAIDGSGNPSLVTKAAFIGGMNYQGTWNAATNTPAIPAAASGNSGYYYKVATAGTTTISGINEWKVGDMLISNGTTWEKIDNTSPITTGVAYVDTAGSDATGAIGDASKPFLTMQAAYDAGARSFELSVGTFTGITGITGTVTISIRGRGIGKTHISQIVGQPDNNPVLVLQDIGPFSCTINEVDVSGQAEAGEGGGGRDAGQVVLRGCYILEGVSANGGEGGPGGVGVQGGNGGLAGGIEMYDCRMSAAASVGVLARGGIGGGNFEDTSGGNGGNGGSILLDRCYVVNPSVWGGDGGFCSASGSNGGNGGTITATFTEMFSYSVGALNGGVAGGTGATDGTVGTFTPFACIYDNGD